MKKCTSCGRSYSDIVTICPNCGRALSSTGKKTGESYTKTVLDAKKDNTKRANKHSVETDISIKNENSGTFIGGQSILQKENILKTKSREEKAAYSKSISKALCKWWLPVFIAMFILEFVQDRFVILVLLIMDIFSIGGAISISKITFDYYEQLDEVKEIIKNSALKSIFATAIGIGIWYITFEKILLFFSLMLIAIASILFVGVIDIKISLKFKKQL